jgi:hypothetical protein
MDFNAVVLPEDSDQRIRNICVKLVLIENSAADMYKSNARTHAKLEDSIDLQTRLVWNVEE